MIAAGAVIAAFLAGAWAWHHPWPAALITLALVLLVTGIVRFCREIAPRLSVASWPPSFARPGPAWEYA